MQSRHGGRRSWLDFDAVEKGCVSRGGMMREGEPMGMGFPERVGTGRLRIRICFGMVKPVTSMSFV